MMEDTERLDGPNCQVSSSVRVQIVTQLHYQI